MRHNDQDFRQSSSHDPIQRSWQEAPSFNTAWMKQGERLTWVQRIGFAIFSLTLFGSGLFVESQALSSLIHGDLFSLGEVMAFVGALIGLLFIIPAALGIRNILRFPKSRSD
jgi:hypothetical protein